MTGATRRGLNPASGSAPDHALRSTRSAANPEATVSAEAEVEQNEAGAEQVKPEPA